MHTKRDLLSLTGIRFFAALMIFVFHFPFPNLPQTLNYITRTWCCGVAFFFILSGFVLTYNYYEDFKILSKKTCWVYFVARFARIYPLYFIVMLFCWLKAESSISFIPYLLGIQAWTLNYKTISAIDAPAWSISVEFFLYFMFPLLAVSASKMKLEQNFKKLVGAFLFLVVILFLLPTYFNLTAKTFLPVTDYRSVFLWINFFPPARLLDFSLGIISGLSFLYYPQKFKFSLVHWSIVTYASCLIIIAIMATFEYYWSAYNIDAFYAVPFFFLLLGLCMNPKTLLAKFLSLRHILILGEISYAFYLLHYPIASVMLTSNATWVLEVLCYLGCLLIIICLSYGFHRLIEIPARTFIRHIPVGFQELQRKRLC